MEPDHNRPRLAASYRFGRVLRTCAAAALALAPVSASAAGLTSRSDLLGSSQAGVATTHTVSFTTATTASIGSIGFGLCTTATGSCVVPTGLASTAATLTAQSGATGFAMNNGVNGAPYLSRAGVSIASGTPLSYTLGNVTSPSTTNQTYYVRITTYTGTDGATGAVDTGQIAVSTATPIQLTGVTPPILVFCVGTTITSDCSSASGSSIDFGDFSPTLTRTGTSVMQAQTNAAGGYAITVNGTTLSSGANTITAMGGSGSTIGTSQFGLNLKANTTPPGGAEATGAGSGAAAAGYNAANVFKFATGDAVAAASLPTSVNTFTSHYMVNINGAQAAGVYTATMTYICTASF